MTGIGWIAVCFGVSLFIFLFMTAVGDDPQKPPPHSSLDG